MQIDIVEQFAIIARQAHEETQAFLVGVCFAALGVCLLCLLFEKFGPIIHKVYKDFLHLDGIGRVVSVVCIVAAAIFGGAKPTKVTNAGADTGINLEGVYVEFTNGLTQVEVKYYGTGVTTSTPVSYRASTTNDWTVATKITPSISADVSPKSLIFGVSGDVTAYPYWWVGDSRPAIIVETTGINITYFAASSTSVVVTFTCDDTHAQTFELQTRVKSGATWSAWATVATVPRGNEMGFSYNGFTVDQTREWRIRAEYTEGE